MKNALKAIIIISMLTPVFSQQWISTSLPITGSIRSIEFLDASSGWIAIFNSSYNPNCKIYKTTDRGINWAFLHEVTLDENNSDICMEIINSTTGLIYYMNKVEKTINSGGNWQTVHQFNNNTQKASIKFVNENIGFLTFTYNHVVYIFKSDDGGSSWSEKENYSYNNYEPFLKDIAIFSTSKAVVVGDNPENNGQTIQQMKFESSNGGNNWGLTISGTNVVNTYDYIIKLPTVDEKYRLLGIEKQTSNSPLNVYCYKYENGNFDKYLITEVSFFEKIGGLTFSTPDYGFTVINDKIYKTYNSGVNWIEEYTTNAPVFYNYNVIKSFGDVVYQGGKYGHFNVREIGATYKTYYDDIEANTTNAFSVDGQMKSTTSSGNERGGNIDLLINNQYLTYNNLSNVFYKWNDNTTNYKTYEYGGTYHNYIWNTDISAYYKGKLHSTTLAAIGTANSSKMIKDTVLNGINTIHLLEESDGGIFYTKSTDNGVNYQNEEVVNYSPSYNDADGNKNANLCIAAKIYSQNPMTVSDVERNVAAVWERYNTYTGKVEIKVAHRGRADITNELMWFRYDHDATGNFISFNAPNGFESKPKLIVGIDHNNISNDNLHTFIVEYLKYNETTGLKELRILGKHGNYYIDQLLDNGNITDFAITSPYHYWDEYKIHSIYIKNNKVYYRKDVVGFAGQGFYYNPGGAEYSVDLTTGVEVLQNKGDLDIALRNASNNPSNPKMLPVITFKGQYNVKIAIPNEDGSGTGVDYIVNTYYPIVYREQLYTTSNNGINWASANGQYLSSTPQQNPNLIGAVTKNSYLINYSQNNSLFIQKVPRWNNLINSGYFCDPSTYTGNDAKFVKNSLINESSTQSLITLGNAQSPYQIGRQSFSVTNSPTEPYPDEITGIVVSDNFAYSFNLGSIMVNSQLIEFNPNMDSVIESAPELNENLKSGTFLLNENDTLVIGRNAFYITQDEQNPFTEIQYNVYLMNKTHEDIFMTLAQDTVHADDTIQVEMLEGFIITGINNGSDSFYVHMVIDTVRNGEDGFVLNSIYGGSVGAGGDNINRNRIFWKKTNFKNSFVPITFYLYQNFPNPFNPVTTIKYDLPKNSNVTIKVYDLLGREVIRLVNNEFKNAGRYEIKWNANNYASGVYIYRIEAGDYVNTKKMVLIK